MGTLEGIKWHTTGMYADNCPKCKCRQQHMVFTGTDPKTGKRWQKRQCINSACGHETEPKEIS